MRCGNERERTIWQFVIVTNKLLDVSFSCVCSVVDTEFRHNIVKVVSGSTATLATLWRNSWSIAGQTHGTDVNLLIRIKTTTTFIYTTKKDIHIKIWILRLKCHVEERIQPLQPASTNSVRSLSRMCLLSTFSVLADLSSEDSFPRNLVPNNLK